MKKFKKVTYQLKDRARALYLSAIEPTSGDPSWAPAYSATLGLSDRDADALFKIQADCIAEVAGVPTGDEKHAIVSGTEFAAKNLANAKAAARGMDPEKAEATLESAEKRAKLFSSFKGILICNSACAAQDKFNGRYDALNEGQKKVVDLQLFVVEVYNPSMQPPLVQLTTAEKLAEHEDKFYWGCYLGGVFQIEPYMMDRKKKRETDGVKIYPQKLIWVGHGERLGGLATAPVDYSAYDSVADEEAAF